MNEVQHTVRSDNAHGQDGAIVEVAQQCSDRGHWHAHAKVEKYHGIGEAREATPYETVEQDGNILVNAGIALLEDLLMGAGGSAYNAANSYIAVGSGTSNPTDPTQTGLATQLARAGMEPTYPSRSGQVISLRSVFNAADSDGAWNEWAIFNHASAGTMLNRKVASLGTKAGGTWTFTVTITIS